MRAQGMRTPPCSPAVHATPGDVSIVVELELHGCASPSVCTEGRWGSVASVQRESAWQGAALPMMDVDATLSQRDQSALHSERNMVARGSGEHAALPDMGDAPESVDLAFTRHRAQNNLFKAFVKLMDKGWKKQKKGYTPLGHWFWVRKQCSLRHAAAAALPPWGGG